MRHFTKRMLPLRGHGIKAVSAMAIFLAASGATVSAQTYYTVDTANNTTLDNLETGVYAIRIKSDKANTDTNGRWLQATSSSVTSGNNVAETVTLSPYTSSADGYLWQVTKTSTTTDNTTTSTYTFQSLSTSMYWGCADNTRTGSNQWTYSTTTSPTQWTLTQCTASGYTDYVYPYTGSNLVCHNTGGTLGTWSISATAANLASLKFYKATETTNVTCTLNFKNSEDTTLLTTTAPLPPGMDMSTLPSSATPLYSHFYTIGSCTSTDKTVSESNATFDYTVTTANMPFTFSTDTKKVWYTARVRNTTESGANNYLMRTGDGNSAIKSKNSTYTTTSITSKADFDNGLWAFVQDGLGVKLLSKGSGKYVTATSTTYTSKKIEVNLTDAGTTFYTAQGDASSDFALTYAGSGSLGDHLSGKLCVWNGDDNFSNSKSDPGSGFKITEANTTDVLAIAKSVANTIVSTYKGSDSNGYLLGLTESKAEELKAKTDTISSVISFDAVYGDGTFAAEPDADTYYRIETYGNFTYKYITSASVLADKEGTVSSTSDDDRAILRANSSAALTPQLWKFEASDDGYNLVNANTGLKAGQLQSATQAGLRMPVASAQESAHLGVFTAKTSGIAGVFNITESGHLLNAYSGGNQTGLGAWDQSGTSAEGNRWKIKAVTEVPVTVSSAAGWASLCMPFAVTLPTDTEAKAYIGTTAADGNLKLKEISGVIPAKTGFLIALNGGGDVTLTISNDNTTALSESNVLDGATTKRTGFEGAANYFLALDPNYNRAVFMQAADDFTVVPANKAYISAAKVQTTTGESSGKLNFVLDGGNTTGISAAQSESQREVKYYDLSGRRVLFPSNGIFVTDKGEKVFVR